MANETPRHLDGVAPNFIVWIGKGEPEHLVKATFANLLGQVLRYVLQTQRTRSKEPSMTFWQNRRARIGSRFDCAAPHNHDRCRPPNCDQAGTDIILQSAAIPYRKSDLNGVEVLLVTSRKRSRWVLPKGKVKRGMPAHRSAAREAFEEAGVVGTISAVPVGTYRQVKTHEDGQAEMIAVRAFPMLVRQENVSWPEMRQRERSWMPINAAIEAVKNGELRAVLITFAGAIPDFA